MALRRIEIGFKTLCQGSEAVRMLAISSQVMPGSEVPTKNLGFKRLLDAFTEDSLITGGL